MQAQYLFGGNFAAVKAGLTGISGAVTTHSTGATAVQYAIGGKAYSKAQISGGTTPTTDAVTGSAITLTANKARAVVWAFDSGGNVKVVAGPIVDLDSAGGYVLAPEFPSIPDSLTPFAYTLHKAGSTLSGTFTFGTSNWNTTGMTHTVVDVLMLPTRPQTS
jgi:hypothetical protein